MNLSIHRPFYNMKKFSSERLLCLAKENLSADPPRLEIPCIVSHELSKRGDRASNKRLRELFRTFTDGKRPFWLQRSRKLILEKTRVDKKRAGRGAGAIKVYMFLTFHEKSKFPYGVYIGQTYRKERIRFEQHKQGVKAGNIRGGKHIQLLPSFTQHLKNPHPNREQALELETKIYELLCNAKINGLPKHRIFGGK